MQKVIDFLHGKKGYILGIAGLVLVYFMKENVINDNLAVLLQGILTLLAGGADYATNKLGISPWIGKK